MKSYLAARSRVLPYRRAQFRVEKRVNKSHSEHERIFESIVNRDEITAETLMRKHVIASYQASKEMLDRLSEAKRNII